MQAQRHFFSKCREFFLKHGQLYKKNGSKVPLLVVIDPKQKHSILLHMHENLGHCGIFSVYEVLRKRFFWPRMHSDINHHVKSCRECQIRSLKHLEIPLRISMLVSLFSKIYIDIMHMPPARGYKYIVAAKDNLSRTSEVAPLRNATAKNLAKFFWEYIFCRYGALLEIVRIMDPRLKKHLINC